MTECQQLEEAVHRLVLPPHRLEQAPVVEFEFWLVVRILREVYGYCALQKNCDPVSVCSWPTFWREMQIITRKSTLKRKAKSEECTYPGERVNNELVCIFVP